MNPVAETPSESPVLSRKDFVTDQDVRWCPGCGDYSILAAVQKVFPTLGIPREKFALISGIGCSSRFPYYMNTYGFHTVHGRPLAVATGLRAANPELSVWVVTGDGDALSIGGNHLIHTLRRNVDVKILLFNNQIYGLTKGQYSPTSEMGKRTKSTPMGSVDAPFSTLSLALGAGATFVARTLDREPKHMVEIFERAAAHKGTAFVEIYQNCNIFNDGAFSLLTEKDTRDAHQLVLQEGEPLIFGKDGEFCIVQEGFRLTVRPRAAVDAAEIVVHREGGDAEYHQALGRLTLQSAGQDHPVVPLGVLRQVAAPTWDDLFGAQVPDASRRPGPADLGALLRGNDTWEVR